VKVGSDGKTIDPSGVTYIINPYDEYAVEEALKVKEKAGSGEVIVLSLGGESNKETIRKALAMGADSGILLKDDQPRDSMDVAKALAEEIKMKKLKTRMPSLFLWENSQSIMIIQLWVS